MDELVIIIIAAGLLATGLLTVAISVKRRQFNAFVAYFAALCIASPAVILATFLRLITAYQCALANIFIIVCVAIGMLASTRRLSGRTNIVSATIDHYGNSQVKELYRKSLEKKGD